MLWCRSHLVWLVFEGSIPTCTCFHLENFLWLVPAAFFIEVVREKRSRQGEDAWSVGYETWNCVVHQEQRPSEIHVLPSEIVYAI